MGLSVTPLAAQFISKSLAVRGKGVGIRLGVTTSECSGMSYSLEYVDVAPPDDLSFESLGVTLFTDPKSLPYLDGTEIGFKVEGEDSGFVINNPNVQSKCGCGDSFSV